MATWDQRNVPDVYSSVDIRAGHLGKEVIKYVNATIKSERNTAALMIQYNSLVFPPGMNAIDAQDIISKRVGKSKKLPSTR